MRSISTENAVMGMELARAIYNGQGTLLMDSGTQLEAHHLPILSRLQVGRILVQDRRVDDVIVEPMIPEDMEARAVRALHLIIDENRGRRPDMIQIDLRLVDKVVREMIDRLFVSFMGEMNVEGCFSQGNYNYVHPAKVAGLSLLLGKAAGYNKAQLLNLGIACMMQNLGYLLLPDPVLSNVRHESEASSAEFKRHPEHGHLLLRKCPDLHFTVGQFVLQHHERWDGSGYPAGLKKEGISQPVRIMAIAATFHALISRRFDDHAYSAPEAAEYIAAYSGELFDPQLVQLFIDNVPLYSKGLMVRLNTGEKGFITDANVGYIGRPKVRICYDRNGFEIRPVEMDLTKQEFQNRLIAEIVDS